MATQTEAKYTFSLIIEVPKALALQPTYSVQGPRTEYLTPELDQFL